MRIKLLRSKGEPSPLRRTLFRPQPNGQVVFTADPSVHPCYSVLRSQRGKVSQPLKFYLFLSARRCLYGAFLLEIALLPPLQVAEPVVGRIFIRIGQGWIVVNGLDESIDGSIRGHDLGSNMDQL